MEQINRNKIIEEVTNEILKEVKNSKKTFTSEKIKERINEKLDQIFKKQEEFKEEIEIEKEFTNLDEGDLLSSFDSFQTKEDADEKKSSNTEIIKENDFEDEEEPKEKKKFFQEISELYRNELDNSINCFKKAFESFKVMKKTSIVEKLLILLFLVVPALFGGLLAFSFLFIVLLLWQFAIFLKVLTKYLEKAEFSLKETITKIKRKISSLKSGGGFFNRLIFSNSLYSLIMFNGILYMLIKGMMLPLKSASQIDKIIANMISKISQGISNTLLAPSQLALNGLEADALRTGKDKIKGKTKEKSKLQLRDINRLKTLLRAKQNLISKNNNNSKKLEMIKSISLKNEISKIILENINKNLLIANQTNNIINLNQENIIKNGKQSNEKFLNNSKSLDIESNFGRLLADNILKNVAEHLIDGNFEKISSIISNKVFSDQEKMHMDARAEIVENEKEVRSANESLKELGINPDKINESYNVAKNEGQSFSEFIQNYSSNFYNLTQEQQFQAAISFADQRVAKEDVQDAKEFDKWADENQNKTFEEYREYKFQAAESDLNTEEKEFQDRYGLDCKELMGDKIKEMGFDSKHQLTDEEFFNVAKEIAVENSKNNEEAINMIKDLKEYNISYKESKVCKQELQEARSQEKESTRFRDELKSQTNEGTGRGNFLKL